MFDKPLFAALLLKAMGARNKNQYYLDSRVTSTYIARLINQKAPAAPSPEVIRKLSAVSQNGITYEELMSAAGHLESIPINEFYSKHSAQWPRVRRAMVDVLAQYIKTTSNDLLIQRIMSHKNITEDMANEYLSTFSGLLNELPDDRLLSVFEAYGGTVSVGQDNVIADLPLPLDASQPLPANRWIPLPVIGTVCAGNGGFAFQEDLGFEYVDEADIKGMAKCFWLRVKGDSMIGEGIMENDLALVWQKDDVDSGSLAVVIVDDTAGQIKRIIKKDSAIVLQAANPAYPLAMFTGEETSRVRIVGQVVETKRKYRGK